MIARAFLFVLLSASAAAALDLTLPGARLTASEGPIADSLILPSRPFEAGETPEVRTGLTTRRAYRLPGRSDTPVQITAPLVQELTDEGFEILFSCSDRDCGGFDFRFGLSLLPAPAMHVDLGDFRYVLARRTDDAGAHFISLVASRAGEAGTLHITEVVPQAAGEPPAPGDSVDKAPPTSGTAPAAFPVPTDDVITRLEAEGHVVLAEIDFPSGAATLPEGDYPSLDALARWLAATPTAQIVLVGHTDAVGSLAANTDLSRRRAASVADRVASIAPEARDRITSAGAGYLSPLASNLDEAGRAANRRVEVVLLSK